MRIIITGATGFIGRNLAERFKNDGHDVIATGRSPEAGQELQEKGIPFLPAEILDPDRLNQVFAPADCVIHCAAKAGDWGKYQVFYDTNVRGTRNVINACKYHRIKKLIFISSPSIYFTGKDRCNISEDDPLPERQTTHYSKTKLMAEKEIMSLQPQELRYIIFRPRAVYGPYDNIIVPRILMLAEKKHVPLINHGKALVDITYVDNFVRAVSNSLSAPDSAWNETYNISNGDPLSIKAWFSQVLQIFDRPFNPKNIPEPAAKTLAAVMEGLGFLPLVNLKPAMTRFSVGYMAKSMTLSLDKARQKLNYAPLLSNRESFEKYAQWYRSR
jgi:nucleoside-diphosphate-sugar epimerase